MAAAAAEAPWSVEIPRGKLSLVVGTNDCIITRLREVTGCQLEVARKHGKGGGQKAVHFQGQKQFVDDEDDPNALVKIFIRGGVKQRTVAAEVIRGVAEGEDPEDFCVRAQGGVVFPHELRHPEREAWARWRLQSVAHKHGALAHLGNSTVRLSSLSGGGLDDEVADALQASAEQVLDDAERLEEIKVEGKDELEPEDAPSDAAIAPLIDQHGIIIRVCDQDDNKVEDTIAIRVVGPKAAAEDAAAMLRDRFVLGKATASVLQALGQAQALAAGMAGDFAKDLKELGEACEVVVRQGQTALWVAGADEEAVSNARGTLREILQFYFGKACAFMTGLAPEVVECILQDDDLGLLMAEGECAVSVDEAEGSVWMAGKQSAAAKERVQAIIQFVKENENGDERGTAATKRRRTGALSFKSV